MTHEWLMTTTISMSVDPPLISGEYCSVISRELPTMTPLASSNFSFESRIAKFTSVLPLVIPKLEDIFEKSAILIQNNNNRKITNSKNRGPDNTNRTQLRSCCSQGLCKSSVLSVLFIVLFVKDRETYHFDPSQFFLTYRLMYWLLTCSLLINY